MPTSCVWGCDTVCHDPVTRALSIIRRDAVRAADNGCPATGTSPRTVDTTHIVDATRTATHRTLRRRVEGDLLRDRGTSGRHRRCESEQVDRVVAHDATRCCYVGIDVNADHEWIGPPRAHSDDAPGPGMANPPRPRERVSSGSER